MTAGMVKPSTRLQAMPVRNAASLYLCFIAARA
jgi:hypothetical protein